MNAAKVEAAKFRISLAGASAIGLLERIVENGKLYGTDHARGYIAQWHAAKAELDAAIEERDTSEIEQIAVSP